jgi:cytochrome c553
MRKVFKYFGILLAVLLLAAAGGALWIGSGLPTYPPGKVDLKVEITPQRVARGKQISSMLCTGCHLDPATGVLSGHRLTDVPPAFGTVYSANITRHPERGVGAWTDGELAYLLRTGVGRDGRYRPAYMPKLPRLDDEDLLSIIAFLRSDDALVAATDRATPPCDPSFLVMLLSRVAWKPFPYPTQKQVRPPRTDAVAYGRYLVNDALDCYACHSADFKKLDLDHPELSAGYLGGGTELLDIAGRSIYSTNITPDGETGIGKWSEADFTRALKAGFRPDNTPILMPMERYPELDDDEARAIFAYLKTVPPIRRARTAAQAAPALAADATPGLKAYRRYGCASCHGDDGVGLADLRRAHEKYPYDEQIKDWIRDASRLRPGTKMPTWDGVIAEDDYQPLCDHVRELGEKAYAAGLLGGKVGDGGAAAPAVEKAATVPFEPASGVPRGAATTGSSSGGLNP